MMKMKAALLLLLLLLLFFSSSSSSSSGLGSVLTRHYSFHIGLRTWQEAQSFCRTSGFNTDLATFYTQSDVDGLYLTKYDAWVGLQRYDRRRWVWSNGYSKSYHDWATGEPDAGDRCAYVHYNSNYRFYGTNCDHHMFFICRHKDEDKYAFIPQGKTWAEAQEFCRAGQEFHELFYPWNSEDIDSAVRERDFPIWTGLHKDGRTWKWPTDHSDYRKWAPGEPGTNGDCVSISSETRDMSSLNCSDRFPFICLRDNVVLVKENKTWEEALDHCRDLGLELLSVQPGEDHDRVIRKIVLAQTEKVWAALRFLAGYWLWVNNANMLYSDLPQCPIRGQLCGALLQNDTGGVEPTDCLEELNFLCYSSG